MLSFLMLQPGMLSQINKAGDNPGRALGQASDYTLRALNPLDSCTHDQSFYQDFGPPNQSGPRYFVLPPLAGLANQCLRNCSYEPG